MVKFLAAALWNGSRVRPLMVATEEPKVSAPPTSSPPPKSEMVVVNNENTQFSAGIVGGIAGERWI